jgi:pSer/pThr/pTyr-binding forkhead associated (FHA) protein
MSIALINSACPEQKFVLSQLPATVGRQARAAVRLEDRRVSHFQCLIDAQDGMLTVLDLGSVSGTFVNGVRRAMATLFHGDRLTVGETDFVVQIVS